MTRAKRGPYGSNRYIPHPNPSGLCQCGCGATTPIAIQSDRKKGHVVGEHVLYIHNHHGRPKTPQYVIKDLGYKTPCWIWSWYSDKNGYGCTTFRGKPMPAHRAYYIQHKGPIPPGFQVDHLCFTPACVNPEHLEAVVPVENQRRRRYVALTPEKVPVIKQLRGWGISYGDIGRLFGVSGSTIYHACAGYNWKDQA